MDRDAITTIDQYRWPVITIDCLRCKRHAHDVKVANLKKKFGGDTTLAMAARMVAGSGQTPCGLALAIGNTSQRANARRECRILGHPRPSP